MAQAAYTEYHIPRDGHALYARSYAGADPALVLMHGFPDNLHIYDALAPLLAAAGRRTVVFDFLGYGASDKPADYPYSTEGLEHDLQAVVDVLELTAIVPVAHDASGPTAINWALDHPERVAALALLNTYYDEAPTLRFPELIACSRIHTMRTSPRPWPGHLPSSAGSWPSKAGRCTARFRRRLERPASETR